MGGRALEPGFVTEGRFLALPLAVPEECDPIAPDESRLTALALSPDGHRVYASTGGQACHVVQTCLLGSNGYAFDLGIIPGAQALPGLVVGREAHGEDQQDSVLVAAAHAEGLRLWRSLARPVYDTIQEPTFAPGDFKPCAERPGWQPRDCRRADGEACWVLGDRGLLRWSPADGWRCLAESGERFATALPRLLTPEGADLAWVEADGSLMGLLGERCERLALLPRPPGQGATACVAAGRVVVACADGEVLSAGRDGVRSLGRTVLAPVRCLSALADGRIFAFCGEGLGHWDCWYPGSGQWRALGAVAATLPRPRYGHSFAAALSGRQGEIWLAEDDQGGCLWLYQPCWPAT
jgi:hypothetical protein